MHPSSLELNVIKNRFDIKRRAKDILSIKEFNFERGLKSFNDEKLKFTNMSLSEDEDVYNMVVDIYLDYLMDGSNFLDDFIGYELENDDKIERLLQIINGTQRTKYKISDIPYILKLNNKNDERLHFFIRYSGKNASLILVDLYHLAIYGEWYKGGKFMHNSIPKTYKHNKNNSCKLEKILELINN